MIACEKMECRECAMIVVFDSKEVPHFFCLPHYDAWIQKNEPADMPTEKVEQLFSPAETWWTNEG